MMNEYLINVGNELVQPKPMCLHMCEEVPKKNTLVMVPTEGAKSGIHPM